MSIKIRRIKEIQNENFQKLLTKFYSKYRIINKDRFEMTFKDIIGSLYLAVKMKTELLFPNDSYILAILNYNHDHFRKLKKFLVDENLIIVHKNSFYDFIENEFEQEITTAEPTNKFKKLFKSLDFDYTEIYRERYNQVRVNIKKKDKKGTKKERHDLTDKFDLSEENKFTDKYNSFLKKHQIIFPKNRFRHIKKYCGDNEELLLTFMRLSDNWKKDIVIDDEFYRIFTFDLNHGGRFYSRFIQSIPSDLRRFLQINGKNVIESDYSSLHIFMAAGLSGQTLDINSDAYHLSDNEEFNKKFTRKKIKLGVLIALNTGLDDTNSASTNKAIASSLSKNFDDYENGDAQKLREAIKDKYEYILNNDIIHNEKLAVPEFMKDITDDQEIELAIGCKLQNYDSELMKSVLNDLMEQNILAIPVHDSVIIPDEYKEIAEKIMKNNFKKMFNHKINVKSTKKVRIS